MCLINRQGRTNSKNLGLYRPFHITWKCGHCAECIREKRNEWLLRSYFESMDTFNNGSNKPYSLFETLTYDDEHLPHIAQFYTQIKRSDDFSCFNYDDIRKFTNNLWTSINRYMRSDSDGKGKKKPILDYNVKENIKVFIASEYGHENIYRDDNGRVRKGTMRPHYHIKIDVKDGRLQPPILFYLIYKIWHRGNTDYSQNGLRNAMYKDVVGRDFTKSKEKNIIAISNYICKYITKQADFMEKVENRINLTLKNVIDKKVEKMYDVKDYQKYIRFEDEDGNVLYRWFSLFDDYKGEIDINEYYAKRKEICARIAPFHRQSRGYGLCALDNVEVYDEILNKLQMTIKDSKYVKKTYAVPLYYMRKMFYRVVTDDEGKYHWVLNELGREKYPQICEKKVQNNIDRYSNLYLNLEGRSKDIVDIMLDGRTFKELSEYIVYYRGRIYDRNKEYIDEETGEITFLPSIAQVIDIDRNYDPLVDTSVYNDGMEIVYRSVVPFGYGDILSKIKFGEWSEDDLLYDDSYEYSDAVHYDFYTYRNFERTMVINENTDYRFRDFDTLINFFLEFKSLKVGGKQNYFDLVENLTKKLK